MGRPSSVTCATSRVFVKGSSGRTSPPRRRAPFQEPEQNRLHLIVPVMPCHQVAGTVTSLHLAQPSVAGPSGDGLRSIGTEAQLTDLERQLVALRQLADRPCD